MFTIVITGSKMKVGQHGEKLLSYIRGGNTNGISD